MTIRNLTSYFKEESNRLVTSEAYLFLLTLTHETLSTPLRFVNDTVQVTSNGQVYLPYQFELYLPEDAYSRTPRVRLTIENVGRELIDTLRAITTPVKAVVQLVLSSRPDVVEVEYADFKLRGIEYDALTISGDLVLEDIMNQTIPGDIYEPAQVPGLF